MDYAGRDQMTLGGRLNPTSGELTKIVNNFATFIQSGTHVVLDNATIFQIWVF